MKNFSALFVFFAFFFVPLFTYAQLRGSIEVTDKEDLKILHALVEEGKRITEGRKACKATAKDYKQECLCDKPQDYFILRKMTSDAWNYSRGLWSDHVLIYEDQGKTARTSMQYFGQINFEFDQGCLPNGDDTFRANREWDKPELTITDPNQAKDLYFVYRRTKDAEIQQGNCQRAGPYSNEECACGYKNKYKALGSRIKSLIKDHPEWYDHVIIYRYDGYTFRTSLESDVRMLRYYISECKK